MIKMVVLVTRRPDIERDEFLRIWQEEHAELILRLPGLRGYRQNPAIPHHKAWAFDGVVELWFDDLDAARRAFQSAAAEAIREHEPKFVRDVETIVVEERTVLAPPLNENDLSSDKRRCNAT